MISPEIHICSHRVKVQGHLSQNYLIWKLVKVKLLDHLNSSLRHHAGQNVPLWIKCTISKTSFECDSHERQFSQFRLLFNFWKQFWPLTYGRNVVFGLCKWRKLTALYNLFFAVHWVTIKVVVFVFKIMQSISWIVYFFSKIVLV